MGSIRRWERIRTGALAALLAATALDAAALSTSKLGPHVLGDPNDDAVKLIVDACPRAAKWLVGGGADLGNIKRYRSNCPGGVVVLRVYVPQSVKYRLSDNASASADDFWRNHVKPHLGGFPPSVVDWLEGVNELDNVEDWYHNGEASMWFAVFSSRLADLIHDAGYNPLLGSIAVGNPALGGELGFGAQGAMGPLAKVIRSKKYKVGWSYHSYGNELFAEADSKYWALRYRMIRDQAGLGGIPIVLTEGGQDGPRRGWRNRNTPEDQYFSWLMWLDEELKKDPEVVGVTLFQVGQSADWADFSLGPIADKLATYLKGSGAEPPPVSPPPPPPGPGPQPPARLAALDGASFDEQPQEVRDSFTAYWGPRDVDPEKRWIGEHNMDVLDPRWREKHSAGQPMVTDNAAGCLDNPARAPEGFVWTAICGGPSCDSNSGCPSGAGGQPGWCFGFPGHNRCLRLDRQ